MQAVSIFDSFNRRNKTREANFRTSALADVTMMPRLCLNQDVMKAEKRTIGKLAFEAGVGVETIRYYERRGLLKQPARQGTARVYNDEALWRVRYVKVGQSWGLSLREMKMLLAGAERSPNFCASIPGAARKRIDGIESEMARLTMQRAELIAFIDECAAKPDADRCPIFQRINGGK